MRLIDADALEEEINLYHRGLKPRYISKLVDAEIDDILDIIGEAPTIDVEVRRGRWVSGEVFGFYDCSECGYKVNWREYKHCPHCGVMMEVDDETL